MGVCPACPGGGGEGEGGYGISTLVTCLGSQGTLCPCSSLMIRLGRPWNLLLLVVGPGPISLMHSARSNKSSSEGDTNTYLKVTIFLYKITTAAVKIILKYCFVFEEIVTNMLLCRSQLFFFGTDLSLFRRIFFTHLVKCSWKCTEIKIECFKTLKSAGTNSFHYTYSTRRQNPGRKIWKEIRN